MYSEETNVLGHQAAIFFGKDQSNTFISDVEGNHNVAIEKEVTFGTSKHKVTKTFIEEKSIWMNCAGKQLIVQKNSLDPEKTHVLVTPTLDEPPGKVRSEPCTRVV